MKILKNYVDPKSHSGSIVLEITNSDDIFLLAKTIKANDKVKTVTSRKTSLDGGRTQTKITLCLELKVESIDVDLADGILYIKGKTCVELEHIKLGSYHSFDICIGTEFTLTKTFWSNLDIKGLKEAAMSSGIDICTCIIYDKDCVISDLYTSGPKIINKCDFSNKNLKNIANVLSTRKSSVKYFIIASVSEARTTLHKFLNKEDPSIYKMCILLKLTPEYKGISNSSTVSKILSDPNYFNSINDVKFIDDLKEMQKIFVAMAQNNKGFCIGRKEVGEAIDYGAVKVLFVTDEFCKPPTMSLRLLSEELISKVKALGSKICIIPIVSDLGTKLKEFGGMICTIRFDFK